MLIGFKKPVYRIRLHTWSKDMEKQGL